jgi:uncharacterized lipoprotein NlpE involved in copper resistance
MILREGLPVKVVTYTYLGEKPQHRNVRCVVYGTFRKQEERSVGMDASNQERKMKVVMLADIVHVDTGGVETPLTMNREYLLKTFKKKWLRCVEMKRLPDHIYMGYKL